MSAYLSEIQLWGLSGDRRMIGQADCRQVLKVVLERLKPLPGEFTSYKRRQGELPTPGDQTPGKFLQFRLYGLLSHAHLSQQGARGDHVLLRVSSTLPGGRDWGDGPDDLQVSFLPGDSRQFL